MQQLLLVEKSFGYSKISLSVQKNNYAVKIIGRQVVDENSEGIDYKSITNNLVYNFISLHTKQLVLN